MKTVLFCADGTWNGPTDDPAATEPCTDGCTLDLDARITNVRRTFDNLAGRVTSDGRAEQEKLLSAPDGSAVQVAKYIHGVGDSSHELDRILGGTIGGGITRRIVRGYTYLSRVWEPGDRIHLVGFSRGAYTARALAGMIASVGLLDPSRYDASKEGEAYRLGIQAWHRSRSVTLTGKGLLSRIASSILGAYERVSGERLREDHLRPDVPMTSVAVWDTVGSLGIPRYHQGERFDLFRFVDTSLSPRVQYGFHAMAIDEERIDFPVTRWTPREGIREAWFCGAHSDVGGGYPQSESGLSDLALDWMTRNLCGLGVRFTDPLPYVPRLDRIDQAIHTPWTSPPFERLPRSLRRPHADDRFHPRVRARYEGASPPYRPAAFALAGLPGEHPLRLDE